MPRRLESIIPGRCYHIYNRGHNRETIFHTPDDYGLFLRKYRQYVSPTHATTLAYVLMPNHYHLLVRAETDELGHAMQLFAISLAKILNRDQGRVGALFQGPFQAKEVPYDEYLLQLTRYLHLNPIRAGLAARPEDWLYSSCREYLGVRSGTLPEMDSVFELLDDSRVPGSSRYERYRHFLAEAAEPAVSTSEVEAGLRKSGHP